jgi:protein O-mannosyl-transferase
MKPNKKRGRFPKLNPELTTPLAKATWWSRLVTEPRSRITVVLASVSLCVLAITAYSNGISNGFVWDDHEQVVMNASLRPDTPLLRLAGANHWGLARGGVQQQINYYRPLQMATYRLTAEVFGFDARAFHAVNLGCHLLAVLLVFALFYKLTARMALAFAGAALFAVHPIHTEAVDWIAALPDIGCTVCFLLAFLFFVLAQGRRPQTPPDEPPRRFPVFFPAASCAAFAAALLWKETAVVFPLIVMAYVFCLGEPAAAIRRVGSALRRSLPYWCILGFYLLLRLRVLGFVVTRQRNWILSRFEFGLTVLN